MPAAWNSVSLSLSLSLSHTHTHTHTQTSDLTNVCQAALKSEVTG